MKTRQKTFTVSIPEGKKAVWNEQGILQLVDEEKANESKDVTERIKTIFDATCELEIRAELGDCEAKQLIEEYDSVNTETSDDIVAYMQLRIITAALNEGWKPKFTKKETLWIPHLTLWTEDDINEMSDNEKDENELFLFDGSANVSSYSGFTPSYTYSDSELHLAFYGSRLAYKTEALATFAALTFAPVYARFFLGDKAKGLKPWREVEGKEEPADEEEES